MSPRTVARAAGALAVISCTLATGQSWAAQFVLVDIAYVHTTTSHKNDARMGPDVPTSWGTPTDYSTGRAYFRLEVRKKPNSTQSTAYQICVIQRQGYACGNQKTFKTTGTLEWNQDLSGFWHNNDRYDWKRKPESVALIVKDNNNRPVDPGGTFAGAPNTSLYYPLDLRFTTWVVTKGSTLNAASLGDAGAPAVDARADAAGGDAALDGARPDDGATNADAAGDAGGDPADSPTETSVGPSDAPLDGAGADAAGAALADASRDTAPRRPEPTPGSPGSDDEPTVRPPRSGEGCTVAGRAAPIPVGVLAAAAPFAAALWRVRRRSTGSGPRRS